MTGLNKNRVLWHIFLWICIWFLLFLIMNNGWENAQALLYRSFPTLLGILILVVLNIQFLLPELYFKKRIGLYFLVSLMLFIGLTWLISNNFFLFSDMTDKFDILERIKARRNRIERPITWLRFAVPLLFSFVASTMFELIHFANKKEKALITIEKEKLDTEIKFLKSQINPHFLFNVLNNIYTLTVIKSEKAPENLLRISDMLRYMLYDSNEDNVPIKKEINYLENYIKLASLKDSRGLNINVDLDKSQPNLPIAPLLFIPFIENAFKHSKIEDLENGFINIELKFSADNILFSVENSVPNIIFNKDKVGGIGLVNTKKRLELLYPQNHVLEIKNDGSKHIVDLKIGVK